jgi:hypothetical protein
MPEYFNSYRLPAYEMQRRLAISRNSAILDWVAWVFERPAGTIGFLFANKGGFTMNLFKIALPFILSLSILTIPGAFAADDKASAATRTMAEIMIGLNHYPSDAEKDKLNKLAGEATTTADEKTIAHALVNLKHKADAADVPKLEAVTKDAAAPAAVKSLASILLSLSHHPSDADIAKLKQIAK